MLSTRPGAYVTATLRIKSNETEIDRVAMVLFTCAIAKSPIFIGKSSFQRLAAPLGFEPRITPPKDADINF